MELKIALLLVIGAAALASASPARYPQNWDQETPFEAEGMTYPEDSTELQTEDELDQLERYLHEHKPDSGLDSTAFFQQQGCTVVAIPAFLFRVNVQVCPVTATQCGLVDVQVGNTIVDTRVEICRRGIYS